MPINQTTDYRLQTTAKGFTLIELLVAITILAIISAIGLTTYSQAQVVARDSRRQQDLRAVSTALVVYYNSQATHAYPTATSCSALGSILATTYINQMPSDPGSYTYACNSNATSYSLCAKLENNNATTGSGIVTSGTGCTGGSKYFYLTNP